MAKDDPSKVDSRLGSSRIMDRNISNQLHGGLRWLNLWNWPRTRRHVRRKSDPDWMLKLHKDLSVMKGKSVYDLFDHIGNK